MKKRGQVTIFIILGLMIVISATLSLYYFNKSTLPEESVDDLSAEKVSLKLQLENCLDDSVEDALVGMQGGYYYTPVKSKEFLQARIPYYFYKNDLFVPQTEEVEEQLAFAIKKIVGNCIELIEENAKKTGLTVGAEIKEIKTKISNETILIEAKIPTKSYYNEIDIVDENSVSDITTINEMNSFKIKKNLHYGKIVGWANEIAQIQAENPAWFPLTKIADLAYDEGFKYEIINEETVVTEGTFDEDTEEDNLLLPEDPQDENKIIISILDNEMFNKPYYFSFAIFYDQDTILKPESLFGE